MTALDALSLLPPWALAFTLALNVMRLSARVPRGVLALTLTLGAWLTALVATCFPASQVEALRLLPSGMLLAGTFVHAGRDLGAPLPRGWLFAAYAFGGAVSLVGAFAPSLLLDGELGRPGVLFWPLAAVSSMATFAVNGWLFFSARAETGRARRRLALFLVANVSSALGGGVAIMANVTLHHGVVFAGWPLGIAVLCVGYIVFGELAGRDRDVLAQGVVLSLITATLSAFGLTLFYYALPSLVPQATIAWTAVVIFIVALPLEPLRSLVSERVLRAWFRRSIAVSDLVAEVRGEETRADQAEKLALVGTLAAGVAHEIRNPLGVILAQLKLLERDGADEKRTEAIRTQVTRATHFVEDLLRYAKPRPLEVHAHALKPIFERAVELTRGLDASSPDIVHVRCDPDARIEADEAALVDLLVVLIQNARIALAETKDARIELLAEADAGHVRIEVLDNGPGVPSELAARLFQPFVTSRGRDAAHPGTGLGLSIAKRHAERHGASLSYEPAPSGGARFVLRWPAHVVVV